MGVLLRIQQSCWKHLTAGVGGGPLEMGEEAVGGRGWWRRLDTRDYQGFRIIMMMGCPLRDEIIRARL